MSPLARIIVALIAVAALLIGVVALVTNRMESGAWQPQYVAMISLSVGNVALVISAFLMLRDRRRRGSGVPTRVGFGGYNERRTL